MFIEEVRRRVRGAGRRVAFAEGIDERAIRAAVWLRGEELAHPILIGAQAEIGQQAKLLGIELDGIAIRDPELGEYAQTYCDLRRHKGITPEAARATTQRSHYFAALMVRAGDAEGMVSGLCGETKPFLPAFEVIGLRDGFSRASSVFIMDWPDRVLFYADCSVNIAPDAATLAEIGIATAATARSFGYEPRVAFLSFSTRDSARHESVDRVKEAAALARAADPELVLDGEIQFDAAFVEAVARRKCPDSPFAAKGANVFIFPDLNAGNIAYKITERLAGARAIGPIMQGLNRPVNDVSRGCSVQDLADVAVITAAMAK